MTIAPDGHVVVVDGSNLATEGRTTPSLRQLDEAVRAYAAEDPGAEIVVVVDASFEHRIDASERKQLIDAELHGEVVSPPAGAIGRGDAFVLRIAERTGAIVLSNDSFQEFHGEHPWLFDKGRLVGGKPVPGVGWIFTPRIPVRGPKSRQAQGKAKGDDARALSPPVKAAELAKAAKKVAARKAPVLPDGSKPKVGDVWPAATTAAAPEAAAAKVKRAEAKSVAQKGGGKAKGEKQVAAKPSSLEGPVAAPAATPGRKAATRKGPPVAPATAEAPRKPAEKRATAKEEAPKKPVAKRAAAMKEPPKKAEPQKVAAKKEVAKKVAARKGAAQKPVAKKAAAKKEAPKKAVAKKAAPKKAVTQKQAKKVPEPLAKKPSAQKTPAKKKALEAAPAKAPPKKATPVPVSTDGAAKARAARSTAAKDPVVQEAIGRALAEAIAPVPEPAEDARGGHGDQKHGKRKGKDGRQRRRRAASPPPAVNEPLAFITFVATYPLERELEGEVVSFTSHGAMVDVDLPGGGVLHSYIPLTAMGDPPPSKARQVLKRGERRRFVLMALDPPRRVAELALPEAGQTAAGR